jgi:tetratricopeptide (TPR) repeat protein
VLFGAADLFFSAVDPSSKPTDNYVMAVDIKFEEALRLAQKADWSGAEERCRRVLENNAADINTLALLGAVLIKAERSEEAEPLLLQVIALEPEFAKPCGDLASLYMQSGNYEGASEYFRKAADIKPDEARFLFGLGSALHELNRNSEASDAYQRYLELAPDGATLADVQALRGTGALQQAAEACGRLLAQQPDEPEVVHQFAIINGEQGRAATAERLLMRMLHLAPDSSVPLIDLAKLCSEQHRFIEAISWFEQAIALLPTDVELRLGLGRALVVVGRAEQALATFDEILKIDFIQPEAMLGRGNALRALGKASEAQGIFHLCLQHENIFPDACWSLASMRDFRFSDTELEGMQSRLESKSISDQAAVPLNFAVGKALDDREDFSAAWKYYMQGCALKRPQLQYDGVQFEVKIDSLIANYTPQLLEREPIVTSSEVRPIFILGMPRSGSTLLEQILASHSKVEGTTELPYLKAVANRSELDQDTGKDMLTAFGKSYLRACEANRSTERPFFIDKLPDNFPYVGFIHLVLPQAIIIDARREPMATCVANLRQLYARGKEFSYDHQELGEMYLQYIRVMQHWEQVLPGKVLTVSYEELVNDTEAQIRRVLQHCGLEWEDACLQFHETERVVTTASAEQVRKPIYADSIDSWRHYESELAELAEILRPVL